MVCRFWIIGNNYLVIPGNTSTLIKICRSKIEKVQGSRYKTIHKVQVQQIEVAYILHLPCTLNLVPCTMYLTISLPSVAIQHITKAAENTSLFLSVESASIRNNSASESADGQGLNPDFPRTTQGCKE